MLGKDEVIVAWSAGRASVAAFIWALSLVIVDVTFRERSALAAIEGSFDVQLIAKYTFYALAGVLALVAVAASPAARRSLTRVQGSLIVAYLVLALASLWYSPYPVFTGVWTLQMAVFVSLTAWFVSSLSNSRALAVLDRTLATVCVAYLLLLVVVPSAVYRPIGFFGELRLGGVYHPNAVSVMLAALIAIRLPRIAAEGVVRRSDFVVLPAALVQLVLTGSRMGLGATAVVTMVSCWYGLKERPRSTLPWAGGLALGALLLLANIGSVYEAVLRRASDVDFGTLTGRVLIWSAALPLLGDGAWLGGYGYGASRVILLERFRGQQLLEHTNLQNGILDSLFNLGVLGTGLLLWIWFASASTLYRQCRHRFQWTHLARLNVLVVLLLNAITEISFFGAPNAQMLMFLYVALSVSRGELPRPLTGADAVDGVPLGSATRP